MIKKLIGKKSVMKIETYHHEGQTKNGEPAVFTVSSRSDIDLWENTGYFLWEKAQKGASAEGREKKVAAMCVLAYFRRPLVKVGSEIAITCDARAIRVLETDMRTLGPVS